MKRSLLLSVLTVGLAAMMVLTSCSDRGKKPEESSSEPSSSSSPSSEPEDEQPPEPEPADLLGEPKAPAADLLQKIRDAQKINSDVIGWLRVPDTDIDNEVLHTVDNTTYERANIKKEYDWYGCYWADYECKFGDRTELSANTIIYGHSMDDKPDGLKFSQLKKYADLEWAKNHPNIYFSTDKDEMVWKVFSVAYTDNHFEYNLADPKKSTLHSIITELQDLSKFDFDVDVDYNDKILLLSTCTYPTGLANKKIDEQARFVIAARLAYPGEEEKTTVEATVNEDVKKPTLIP